MGKGIPERWESYSNMGRKIPGTRFIPFKVPLKEALLTKLDAGVSSFDPRFVMDHCSDLGMVIDLTNTNRYYNPEEFKVNNIEYFKLNIFGHVIPKTSVVYKFFSIVENFLERNIKNDKLIGVHCTHGINRTGYMICRYMIEQLGVSPDEAISAFNSARGHEIERENYLQDLRKGDWALESPSQAYSINARNEQSIDSSSRFGNSSSYSKKRTREPEEEYNYADYGVGLPYLPHRYQTRRSSHSRYYLDRRESNSSSYIESPPPLRRQKLDSPQEFYSKSNVAKHGGSFPSFKNLEFSLDLEKLPKHGKAYYEKHFGNEIKPLYENDFYRRRGGGIGPHRPPPRSLPLLRNDGRAPRQYAGPRRYKAKTNEDTDNNYTEGSDNVPSSSMMSPPTYYTTKTPIQHSRTSSRDKEYSPYFTRSFSSPYPKSASPTAYNRSFSSPYPGASNGPGRNIFSPGMRNVFSPEDNQRSRRYQPY